MKKFAILIGQLLILAFFIFCARESWRAYTDEKSSLHLEKEGIPVIVRVAKATYEKRFWKDYITNTRYIYFQYKGKDYDLRWLQDTLFMQEGVKLKLLYDPATDRFAQPGLSFHAQPLYKTSPLVRWSALSLFSGPHRWLFAFIVCAGLVTIFGSSILSTLTGIALIGRIGEAVTFLMALATVTWISYDAIKYYQYFTHLRQAGHEDTATVDDSYREHFGGHSSQDAFPIYDYSAKVQYRGESRLIAISGSDYDRFKDQKDPPIRVICDPVIDDLVSADYSLRYSSLLFPLVCWGILVFSIRRSIKKKD